MLHIIFSLLGYGLIDILMYVNNSYHWIKGFVKKEIVLKNKFLFTLNAFLSLYFVDQNVYHWDVIKYTRAHTYVCVCGRVEECGFLCTFATVWHSYMFHWSPDLVDHRVLIFFLRTPGLFVCANLLFHQMTDCNCLHGYSTLK